MKLKLSILLHKLEELGYFSEFDQAYVDSQSVDKFSFIYKGQLFSIHQIFINDYMELSDDIPIECFDYHYSFTVDNNIEIELVYSEEDDLFLIQSADENIQSVFPYESFVKSSVLGVNYSIEINTKDIQFNIDNEVIDLDIIKLKKTNTPMDYFEHKIWVYFEVANKTSAAKILQSVEFIESMNEVEYGFNVKIANQQIPEITRTLTENNCAIYQVTRV